MFGNASVTLKNGPGSLKLSLYPILPTSLINHTVFVDIKHHEKKKKKKNEKKKKNA